MNNLYHIWKCRLKFIFHQFKLLLTLGTLHTLKLIPSTPGISRDFEARVIIKNHMKLQFYVVFCHFLLTFAARRDIFSIYAACGLHFFQMQPSYRFEFETPYLHLLP